MFKKISWYKKNIAIVMACSSLSAAVWAGDADVGIITFTGGVTAETCKISTSNGTAASNMTLVMPVVAKDDISAATIDSGGVGRTFFDISLSNCGAGINDAKIAFSSEQFADVTDGTLRNDDTMEGGAKNVNIVLFNNSNSQTSQVIIGRPDDTPQDAILTDSSGSFSFVAAYVPSAQYQSGTNEIVPGKISTNATFSISYY
ncbi:fimbrial protein [Citrobacter youngae]|uniref:Fimbrial protein n=1 Tax=Citrobacter youngae ATCC 29220 TaxID=500640 RepID=D4BKI1_9ENTR|nr:fimbrial protein [Citrobacter youngae]EFE05612.1 fimbrial protein [Citrobacter youngae ATCC 29220]